MGTTSIIIFAIALVLTAGLAGLIYSMLWAMFNAVFQASEHHCRGRKKKCQAHVKRRANR